MITPWEAFLVWFDSVPLSLRKALAHVFRVCTTNNTSQMAVSSQESLDRFYHWVCGTDFPLRIAARMFYIRSVFDLVICHHDGIVKDTVAQDWDNDKVVPISAKQWEEVLTSWAALRNRELSDAYIHSWASWMISLQSKAS